MRLYTNYMGSRNNKTAARFSCCGFCLNIGIRKTWKLLIQFRRSASGYAYKKHIKTFGLAGCFDMESALFSVHTPSMRRNIRTDDRVRWQGWLTVNSLSLLDLSSWLMGLLELCYWLRNHLPCCHLRSAVCFIQSQRSSIFHSSDVMQ